MSKNNIENCIQESLKIYFQDLDGECAHDIYKMVISCVEKQMFECVLEHAEGNQSLAAKYLGINRNTLHKKLQQYNLP